MTIHPFKLGALMTASALFGAVSLGALSGFQANTQPKFAMVDIGKVFDGSKLAAENNDTLQTARKTRADTLQFLAQNLAIDPKDTQRYSDLATKATATAPLNPTEKAELDRLRASAESTTRTSKELSQKQTLTDEDKKALSAYGSNQQANRVLLGQIQGAYETDLQNMRDDLRDKTLDRVQVMIRKIGAEKGFTVVYSSASAPYAATDLTTDCVTAMKK